MPRVHKKTAAKDYPSHGIKKGQTYYEWAFFRQRAQKSPTPPTRAQLTQNEALAGLYKIVDTRLATATCAEDLRTMGEELQSLASDEQAKFDDLPEGFQAGETGQRIETRAQEIESYAGEFETAADELGDEDDWVPADNDDQTYAEAVAAKIEELQGSEPSLD